MNFIYLHRKSLSCRILFKSFLNFKMYCTRAYHEDIKTFVFLDSETTGLPKLEQNKTRITELCIIAIQAEHIRLGVFPRVQNKINFCFNPNKQISPEATNITGLNNNLLEYQPQFNSNVALLIKNFLNAHQKPICIVAHNGNRFDYPILRAELSRQNCNLDNDVLCIDSLEAFRQIELGANKIPKAEHKQIPVEFSDGYDQILVEAAEALEKCLIRQTDTQNNNHALKTIGNTPTSNNSFKLGDIYTRYTSKQASNAHNAEGDVNMLIMCAATLGDEFVDWANRNAKKFLDIPIMTPGMRLY